MIMNPKCRNTACEFHSSNKEGHPLPKGWLEVCLAEKISITATGECETYWLSVARGGSKDIRTLPEYKPMEPMFKKEVTMERPIQCARYYNANGFAVAIVAVITPNIDWAAYIGSTSDAWLSQDTIDWVSTKGCKLSREDARYYFPNIKLPYRE